MEDISIKQTLIEIGIDCCNNKNDSQQHIAKTQKLKKIIFYASCVGDDSIFWRSVIHCSGIDKKKHDAACGCLSCKKLCDTAVLSFHLKVQTISTSLHLFFFAHFSISWLTRQTSIPVLLGLVRVLINYAPSCLMVCFTCHVTKVSFVSFVSFEDLL